MATKSIAWNTGSGNITLTYQGQGDGTVTINSDQNNLDTARSQVINIETTAGSPVVVKNFTVSQAACPVPVGTVLDYAYTGSYQEVELPAGQYKLQCWGAQGGSNAAASSYGITAKAGGKGGYSEGVLTLTSKTTVRIYVGGAGSSSAGGFNGGGSTSGSSSYSSGNEQGVSRMGGGGGATDIRLSDGALLSRMIVAGGGSGGAMCYQSKTTTGYTTVISSSLSSAIITSAGQYGYECRFDVSKSGFPNGTYRYTISNLASGTSLYAVNYYSYNGSTRVQAIGLGSSKSATFTVSLSGTFNTVRFCVYVSNYSSGTVKVERQTSSTSTSTESQVGGVGGGTQGGAYSSSYAGKQNDAGSGGSFGQGAAQSATNYRYASGAGGGGWYGGGSSYSDSSMTNSKYAGGGSGFVNIAANTQYRPSGYTGLQLDSGETKAGDNSFPSTSGGTETGHSGNGYARITRLS